MATPDYYSKIRSILWPILVFRVNHDQPLAPQIRFRAEIQQKAAKALLRLPTGGAPEKLVRHVDTWAKHLQAGQAIFEETEALGLFDESAASEEVEKPGLVRRIAGMLFPLLAPHTFEAIQKVDRRNAARESAQVAALEKRMAKRKEERDRLEAVLERLGADLVPDFRNQNYFWGQRWEGSRDLNVPAETFLGVSRKRLEGQLKVLPGGDGLSNVEIFPSSDVRFAIIGSVEEGFALGHIDRTNGECHQSAREDYSLKEALDLAIKFCDDPESWEALVEWRGVTA